MPAQLDTLRSRARRFVDGSDQTLRNAQAIEGLADELFPQDDVVQDAVSDLARFSPGGGPHLLDEQDAARVCRALLQRLDDSAE